MSVIEHDKTKIRLRKLCVTAILSAIAVILQLLEFPIPFLIPSFVKMDFSELPALLASFSAGPLWGVAVCLIKNLVNLPTSGSMYVGELCNFLLGVALVVPAGVIYRCKKTRGGAILACVVGSILMALLSYPINYYISYPIYCQLFGGEERVLSAYQAILPSMPSLAVCIAVFNIPFTLVKALIDSLFTFVLYKPLSPLLKGKKESGNKVEPGKR